MSAFDLQLQSTTQNEHIKNVTSFIAEDDSGSFGVMAGHIRFMTTLPFGIARYRCDNEDWIYLALPGAVIYFNDNALTLNTRHYVSHRDYAELSNLLQTQLLNEEKNLKIIKHSLHHMEEEMLKRMWEIRRAGESLF